MSPKKKNSSQNETKKDLSNEKPDADEPKEDTPEPEAPDNKTDEPLIEDPVEELEPPVISREIIRLKPAALSKLKVGDRFEVDNVLYELIELGTNVIAQNVESGIKLGMGHKTVVIPVE